jgi:ketosteroid isomerase-like protein
MELWELMAREAVRDLVARYNAFGDSGRFDQMVEVFAPDAVMDMDGVVVHGRDNIRAAFADVGAGFKADSGALVDPAPPPGVQSKVRPHLRHCTATTAIEVLSPTEARSRSYYFVLTAKGLDHWGRYVDEFREIDGRWYITHRRESIDACLEGSWAATTEISAPYIVRGLSF